jgi:hypothetical protein
VNPHIHPVALRGIHAFGRSLEHFSHTVHFSDSEGLQQSTETNSGPMTAKGCRLAKTSPRILAILRG